MSKYLLLLISIFFVSACSTNKAVIGKLPESNNDFMRDQAELREIYPDIDKHDGPLSHGVFASIYDMPEMQGVTSQLGEPDKKRPSWWNIYPAIIFAVFGLPPAWIVGGGALLIPFHPTSVYRWEKPNYEIEAVVDHPMAFDYAPHLKYWRWYYNPGNEKDKSNQELARESSAQ